MGYYIDFKNISIDDYKEILKSADLLPSRKILKTNIDDIFDTIKEQEIEDVSELRKAVSNKSKLQEFSKRSGIQEDYKKYLLEK